MKSLIKLIVAISLFSQSVFAYSDSYDFSDEPDYVTSGENREGHADGNCVGGGCGDRPERVRAENRGADQFDQERYDFDNNESPRSEHAGRGGDFLERGDDGSRDRDAGLNWVDRSELYYDAQGRDYVKSRDGKKYLRVDDLYSCSQTLSCYEKGYKVNWWSYPSFPGETSAVANEYFENADFAKNAHNISLALDKMKSTVDPVFSSHAFSLNQEANIQFVNGLKDEAVQTQKAVIQLVGLFVDIGIGFTPLGWARDVYEFTTGKSLVDGRMLSANERMLAGLGVVIPGVATLAISGIKIVRKAAAIDKNLSALVPNIYKLTELSNGLKPIRFKAGRVMNKVAIVGRDMSVVKQVEAHLVKSGLDVKVFNASESAFSELVTEGQKYANGRVPYDLIPNTNIYEENVRWIAEMKSEGRTFIDYGDPGAKNLKDGFSAFYDVEFSMIFGK